MNSGSQSVPRFVAEQLQAFCWDFAPAPVARQTDGCWNWQSTGGVLSRDLDPPEMRLVGALWAAFGTGVMPPEVHTVV